jgi:hypothetical protein
VILDGDTQKLMASIRATVQAIEINKPIPASALDVSLPNGTVVHDYRNGQDKVEWIGGNPFLESESHVSCRVLVIVNVCAVVLILAIVILLRHKRPVRK